VATVLSYVTRHAHVLLDRRLFLPKEWADDTARRKKAKVPDEVSFQTKPEQALTMLERAWEQGVPMRWVTGDEVYGNAPYLRDGIDAHGRWYVLATSSSTPVWASRPHMAEPKTATGGRPQTKPRLAEDASAAQSVAAVVRSWPAQAWQRLRVAEGEKGPRVYDWARARVVENAEGLPSREGWLLARRCVSDPTQVAYYLSNAPLAIPLRTLAEVAAQRYTIEQSIEEAKSETGLDEYEVRFWHSWYRHITLSMMAHAWLAAIRQVALAPSQTAPSSPQPLSPP
jgi:SRSO17 transposase